METDVALELRGVSLEYSSALALRSVSLTLPARAQAAIVGPSGAGKTTLLKLCGAGLLPDSGSVLVSRNETSSLSRTALRRLRSRIGFIHQSFDLIPNIRVFQNVLYGRAGSLGAFRCLKESLFASREVLEEIYQVLERLGISEKMYERTDRLSGGQLQRVAIARALFQKPEILLADEPVSSVDPARARSTIELFCTLAKESRCTLLVSLHSFELAEEFFPEIIGMRHGELVFKQAPAAVTPEMRETLYRLDENELLG